MAAPTVTARGTPDLPRMKDGFKALVAFAVNDTIGFYEISPKPPGIDAGDAIDITTMHEDEWRIFAARQLKTLTESSFAAGWNPGLYDDILDLVGVEGSITYHFSNGGSVSFYGFLKTFEPQELKEGEFPQSNVTIVPTNYDPINEVEEGPLYTAPGT